MDSGRFPQDTAPRLSTSLAGAYLGVVALCWGSHLAAAVLAVVTGRTSWTTENPWIVLPVAAVLASAVGIVWLVDRRLHADRPRGTTTLRMLGLVYGSAVPAAWPRLRG
jgi:hypothetical protein